MSGLLDSSGWQVLRHGGREEDVWRQVFFGEEDDARSQFSAEYRSLPADLDSPGGVRLIGPDGRLLRESWAPRVRPSLWPSGRDGRSEP